MSMQVNINSILNTTVIVGLNYFNSHGQLIQQRQLAGTVVETDGEKGIAIQLFAPPGSTAETNHFVLPAALDCWFHAPAGDFHVPDSGIKISDPDFLVTWNIQQTQTMVEDGTHQWWEWLPNTVPPKVNSS